MTNAKHTVLPENAARFLEWIAERGGVAVWESVDLSDLDFSVSTPLRERSGALVNPPHWKVGQTPARVIVDPAEVEVVTYREVKRFRVGVRPSSGGFALKVTDGGTRRIRAAVAKAGDGATYHFDYDTQEAVILVPEGKVALSEWRGAAAYASLGGFAGGTQPAKE